MQLKVLGSSSSGNCYLLYNENETLILECGLPYKTILKGLNFNLRNIVGVLVSHEHKDHSKAIKDMMNNGIDVYTSVGTVEALNIADYAVTSYRLSFLKSEEQCHIGKFTVMPFATEHDVAESLGFLIHHADMGTLLFATDTYYIQYNFPGLNHVLIECNYDLEIIRENVHNKILNIGLAERLSKSHMSLNECKAFLSKTNLSMVKNIVLIHLSDSNSDANYFQESIEKLTGKPTYVAESGLEIDLEGEFDG